MKIEGFHLRVACVFLQTLTDGRASATSLQMLARPKKSNAKKVFLRIVAGYSL
ncbi:hypothetical protein J4G07_19470 [Candidatus Poribacteria bacterium]|nr:hypothetical protein [Candidatus Poribacteria bacterium]